MKKQNKFYFKILLLLFFYLSFLLSFLYFSHIIYDLNYMNEIKKTKKIDNNIKIKKYYFSKNYIAIKKDNNYLIHYFSINNFSFYVLIITMIISIIWSWIIYKLIKNYEENNCLFKQTNLEALATQNSMTILTENIHHELNSPLKVLELNCKKLKQFLLYFLSEKYIGKKIDNIEEFKKYIEKEKIYYFNYKNGKYSFYQLFEIFELSNTSLEQIKSILQNMANFKQLRYSNGNKSIYNLIEGAYKILNIISDHNFEIEIDKKLKNYKINHQSGLKNADLLNVLLNHFKNSIEANATKIEVFIENIKGNYLLLNIKDNGNGIPDYIVCDLFSPNKSSKSDTIGLRGNGLFLNQRILESFGGNIKLKKTKIGEGTEFIIKIPIEKK